MANKKFDSVRASFMAKVRELLAEDGDVLTTNSNELCVPILSDDNDEGYLVITFKVPTGSRDGEVYDGYIVAEDYAQKCKEREEKAKQQALEKARKIERDKHMREEKARLKAERAKANGGA